MSYRHKKAYYEKRRKPQTLHDMIMWGYDRTNEMWRVVSVDSTGRVIIDPTDLDNTYLRIDKTNDASPKAILDDGSIAMAADLDLDTNDLINSTVRLKHWTWGIQLRNRADTAWYIHEANDFTWHGILRPSATEVGGNVGVADVNGKWLRMQGYFNARINVAEIINDEFIFLARGTPSNTTEGSVYFDSTTKKLRVYDGTAWRDLH